MSVICPYCGQEAELVKGESIYPHRAGLANRLFWRCKPCEAWVGCHEGTETPLGRLADVALREAKRAAHDAFDPLWRALVTDGFSKTKARARAYNRLAEALGINVNDCHIGMFDLDLCMRTVAACRTLDLSEKQRSQAA